MMRFSQLKRLFNPAPCLYITTTSSTGRTGTVPVWFFVYQHEIYFCAHRDSLKIRRIRRNPDVQIQIGNNAASLMNCTARIIENHTALTWRLIRTYRRRYPIGWLFMGRRIRHRFMQGLEVIVELTPSDMPDQILAFYFA